MLNQRILRRPELLFEPVWWPICRVRILIVTDSSSGGYGPLAGFHLGEVLNALADDPWWHARFVITKAHRQVAATADLQNFRFDQHDLGQYSQIWLFGIERETDPLSQAELRALAEFMDGDGGVFATGDHEDLGRAMCAEVPRVRSMRRWYFPNPGPNGEPAAPPVSGIDRHDTVMDTSLLIGLQGDQSDKVPQPIRPRWYHRKLGSGLIHRIHKFPHPVLCGPDGVITYLPDHMHEGLCEVPADLSQTHTFAGYACVEYPTIGADQESPQVIAWATTRNTDNDEFGVIAAYDGHRARVGRVVVDATWHHWFNINLMGFVQATDPTDVGAYDPAVVPKWEAIKAYFRNVAVWLARPGVQTCLRNGGWLVATKYYDILIAYRPNLRAVPDRLAYYWQLGVFARDAFGKVASQCQSTLWVIELLRWVDLQLDPWPPIVKRPPLPDPPPWLDVEEFETVALGGAIHTLIEAFGREREVEELLDRRAEEIEAVARKGAAVAVAEWAERYAGHTRDLNALADLARRQL